MGDVAVVDGSVVILTEGVRDSAVFAESVAKVVMKSGMYITARGNDESPFLPLLAESTPAHPDPNHQQPRN